LTEINQPISKWTDIGNLEHKVRILQKDWLTHNVISLKLERPAGFGFRPGQAIELTIDENSYINDAAPFTLTGIHTASCLELILKIYPQHNGITLGLSKLTEGDYLLIGDAWDSFSYKGRGLTLPEVQALLLSLPSWEIWRLMGAPMDSSYFLPTNPWRTFSWRMSFPQCRDCGSLISWAKKKWKVMVTGESERTFCKSKFQVSISFSTSVALVGSHWTLKNILSSWGQTKTKSLANIDALPNNLQSFK